MTAVRSLTVSVCAALMLFSGSAGAAYYTFTGKFTSNRGKIINIPVVGNTPCAPMSIMSGPGVAVPQTMTPATHMIVRGANTQPGKKVTTNFNGVTSKGARDLRCVKNIADGRHNLIKTDGKGTSKGGKGGGFVMPKKAWSVPLPPHTRAVAVKYAPPVLELATSFKITGPRTGTKGMSRVFGVRGTMAGGGNTAPQNLFKKWTATPSTFKNHESGRAAAKFTWCPGKLTGGKGAPCTNISKASPPKLIVKYAPGVNKFGGTMAYIITTGPNTSSLGVGIAAGGTKAGAGFQILAGQGSQPTGRGYADFNTDHLAKGPIFKTATLMKVPSPSPTMIVGSQTLITMVGPKAPFSFPSGTNFNWGFPFTTGHVLVRNYKTRTTTLTQHGSDKRGTPTAMGKRNLSLVAGGIAIANLVGAAKQPTPELETMIMSLPEPGGSLSLVAGVAALLGIAAWRARRVH